MDHNLLPAGQLHSGHPSPPCYGQISWRVGGTTAFVCAFQQPALLCEGGTDGTPCLLHRFEVDLSDPDAGGKLQQFHVDHNPPIYLTCLGTGSKRSLPSPVE